MILASFFELFDPVDIFPTETRNNIFVHYVVKVVPCFLIWIKLMNDLVQTKAFKNECVKNDQLL
jgi:hypothetical protein